MGGGDERLEKPGRRGRPFFSLETPSGEGYVEFEKHMLIGAETGT